jgi:hypothetical protein
MVSFDYQGRASAVPAGRVEAPDRGALTGPCTPSSIGLRCVLSEAVLGVLALLAGIATR